MTKTDPDNRPLSVTTRICGIPLYGIAAGIGMFALQRGLYLLANVISEAAGFPWHTSKIAWIDDRIPLWPAFVTVYVLSYRFWIAGPMAVSLCEMDHFKDFIAGMLLSFLVGAFIFTVYPTRMDRVAENLLNSDPGIFNSWLQFIFRMDGTRYGTNLFPSYHCLISTCCYMGVRKRAEVPGWYRVFSFIFCIPIFMSTVVCKQHYILDIPSGITIAVVCHILAERYHFGRIFPSRKRA